GVAGRQVGRVARLRDRVRRVAARLGTVLVTHREAQVAGRQGEQRTGQVGEVAGGLGGAGAVLFLEQVVDKPRVVQGVGNRAGAAARKRVPRHATGNLGTRGAADNLTLRVRERRAYRVANVRDEEVAVVDDIDVRLVVQRARIPVEVTLAKLERTLKGRGEAPGGGVALGGTRLLPATTTPVNLGARDRVE